MANSIINELTEVVLVNSRKVSKKFAELLVDEHINSYVDENEKVEKVSAKFVGNLIFYFWLISSILFAYASIERFIGWMFDFNDFPIIQILFSTCWCVCGFFASRRIYIDITNELHNKNLLK